MLPLIALTLLAFFLRVWQLDEAPPGWRDDELINSLVISQRVLDGDWAVYYPDASGHEALYHILNAAMLALFGPGTAGIRLLSAILGTLTVPLTYVVGQRLFGRAVGFLAAALMVVSFWSLMYSRVGIRHISLPVFMLAAFYFFLRGLGIDGARTIRDEDDHLPSPGRRTDFLLSGLFMGIGFYTYFASRGIPLILLAFCVYLLLFQRSRLRDRWRGLILAFAVALTLALPLAITLGRQPESEARVEELAVPITAAREGDFAPLTEHVSRTLGMFHAGGDEEWLYNIPFRPVFGPLAAVFFWSGVAIAAWYALAPLGRLIRRREGLHARPNRNDDLEAAGSFVLIWWLAGISPGFMSVPAASLGHTIVAQSATYILAALPILVIGRLSQRLFSGSGSRSAAWLAPLGAGLLLLVAVAWRDLPDYFVSWPERGMTRFLYRADIRDLAGYLNEHPDLTDIGVASFLAGPWDRLALDIDLQEPTEFRPRWFNPERVTLLETGGEAAMTFKGDVPGPPLDDSSYVPLTGVSAGAFDLYEVSYEPSPASAEAVCFQNGLCATEAQYDSGDGRLRVIWQVAQPLDVPPQPLISNPPPPDVYAGPRLLVFAQRLDEEGHVLDGDDGLWIDATTLMPGDLFRQVHFLSEPGDAAGLVVFGLYDPMTGDRILTTDGRDHLHLEVES
ncbi:MAG: glycosyltransferase family 39 protein [Chloroflexota bacterium]|nr:MAG: glycosyltransferase family 39 protein [Chloroflexota bacterium]